MASLNETGMGIGDFAQALLKQEKDNPQPVSKPTRKGNVPDIEDVQVLQEDVDAVLSNSFGVRKQDVPKINLQEERKKQLKEEIQVKLNELKALLNELGVTAGTTTVGNLGINMATVKDGKSNKNYKAVKRRRKSR